MTAPAFTVKNAVLCRMVGADFEAHEITLRTVAGAFPYIVAGNYVVLPQNDFAKLKELAALAKARGESA